MGQKLYFWEKVYFDQLLEFQIHCIAFIIPSYIITVSYFQGWKILKISTRSTSTYVLVNLIIYIGNSQNFYSSCSMSGTRHGERTCGFFQL